MGILKRLWESAKEEDRAIFRAQMIADALEEKEKNRTECGNCGKRGTMKASCQSGWCEDEKSLCNDCAKKCKKCGKFFCSRHLNKHKCR